jgi:hypothetical protein
MKLIAVIDQLNAFERNAFIKVIETLKSRNPQLSKAIDAAMVSGSDLKNADNKIISDVFEILTPAFHNHVKTEFRNVTSQLDVAIDIFIREGNSIMKLDWFSRLYEAEVKTLKSRVKEFSDALDDEKSDVPDTKRRDYTIYRGCLRTAYTNDETNKQEAKITSDEQSILLTLSKKLGLSQDEIKLINYSILPLKSQGSDKIESVINELRAIGVVFFSKKTNIVYVPDEIVRVLRHIRGKDVADKHTRRILRTFKDPQLNLVCRKHSVPTKLDRESKIQEIIARGVSLLSLLTEDIHKDGTKNSEKRAHLNAFITNELGITQNIKGSTLEEKISNLIVYFDQLDSDDRIHISMDGYTRMLSDLAAGLKHIPKFLKSHYQFQEEDFLNADFLLLHNIKPRDILELISPEDLLQFCKAKGIKTRGNEILNILETYKDIENLYLENYGLIGKRDLNALKEKGIIVKEVDLGVKFEELTKKLFSDLGFDVDDKLRAALNTKSDKMDILIKFDSTDVIIVECKSVKEHGYNKFSQVSRQLGAYCKLVEEKGYKVKKVLLVAPEFSQDFINEATLDLHLGISLITAESLLAIRNGFIKTGKKQMPITLLMRDVVIKDEVVLKAISR